MSADENLELRISLPLHVYHTMDPVNLYTSGRNSSASGIVRWLLYVALIGAVVLLVFYAFPHIFHWLRTEFFKEAIPNTGDVFDGVSAFFSAVAFGLLILTVLLQGYELSLQRRELRDTRAVLQHQASTLDMQQFDATFFNLISFHNEIVRSLVLIDRQIRRVGGMLGSGKVHGGEDIRYEGHEVPPVLLERLRRDLHQAKSELPDQPREVHFKRAYELLFVKHRDLLGHYFRNLYHVVKFVHGSSIKDKKQYTNFLRAQLSGSEIELLFFNCQSQWGEHFFKLAVEYALLEHLPLDGQVPPELLLWYPRETYGDNTALLDHYDRLAAACKQANGGSEIPSLMETQVAPPSA